VAGGVAGAQENLHKGIVTAGRAGSKSKIAGFNGKITVGINAGLIKMVNDDADFLAGSEFYCRLPDSGFNVAVWVNVHNPVMRHMGNVCKRNFSA